MGRFNAERLTQFLSSRSTSPAPFSPKRASGHNQASEHLINPSAGSSKIEPLSEAVREEQQPNSGPDALGSQQVGVQVDGADDSNVISIAPAPGRTGDDHIVAKFEEAAQRQNGHAK